jgi:hypothetical protein
MRRKKILAENWCKTKVHKNASGVSNLVHKNASEKILAENWCKNESPQKCIRKKFWLKTDAKMKVHKNASEKFLKNLAENWCKNGSPQKCIRKKFGWKLMQKW